MIRISTLIAAVVTVVASWSAAEAQSRSRSNDPRSRRSSSFREALERARATSSNVVGKEEKATPTGAQVDVELLFLEITTTMNAKNPVPKLTGSSDEVNKALELMKKNGQLKTLNRVSLSAIHGRNSMTQSGGSRSIVTSIADRFGGRGRAPRGASRSYSSRSFGTMVTLTPTVEETGAVVLDVRLEKTWLQGADGEAEAGETTKPPGTATVSIQGTTRLKNGQYGVLSSSSESSKNGIDRIVVLASATVNEPRRFGGPQPIKIFKLKNAQAKSVAKTLDALLGDRKATMVADERTNSLLVKGSRDDVMVIEAVLQKLDEKP